MGKGDKRSRRGKIYRGSFGKTRPKDPDERKKKKTGTTASTPRR
jgi:30S ribosomal protein S31